MSILSSCVAQEVKLQSSGAIPHEGTKRNRHCNVPVFCLFGMGNCAQAQLPSTRYQKKQALQCACFFVYSSWGICAQAQLPSTRYKKKQALQCACFLFIQHGEFAPKRNFPQHGTKRNRHHNVPVFLFIRHVEFAPKRNFPQHGTKRNRHCNVPVFCCNERGTERRVKKTACGQAELFAGICSFALSLDLGKRRTGAGGFAEGRKRARGQPARHTRAFVY